MGALDRLIPAPRLLEIDHVDLAVPTDRAWSEVRHGAIAGTPFIAALFALRTLPERLRGRSPGPGRLDLDALVSTPERPGFQIFAEDPPHELVAGAIGKVWRLLIPFVHVPDADAFAHFAEPDYARIAWALQVTPRGGSGSRVTFELRVDATDDAAWRKFRRYFRVIGPGSHFIRRSVLNALARRLGRAEAADGRSEQQR
jgi:hypothetical protein